MSGDRPTRSKQVGGLLAGLGAGAEAVLDKRLGDGRADRHARIEAGEGVLEDHLDAAAHLAQADRVEVQHVVAVKADRAGVRLRSGA